MSIESFSLPEIMSNEISALVRSGFYSSKSDVMKDAFRCLFEHKPNLKLTAAIEIYKEDKVSLGRAAEIAEMNTFDFKEALADRGIIRTISSTKKRRNKGLKILKKK